MFRRFDKLVEREFSGLLDTSKVAWQEGLKTQYVTSDFREAMLDIDPGLYQEAEFGVFVKNNSIEADKLRALKQLTLSFAQNGSSPVTIAEILEGTNFSKIKEKLAEVDAKEKELQAAQAKQQQEMAQMAQQAQMADKQADREFEAQQNQLDRDAKMDIEEMKIAAKVVDQDMNDNGINDAVDLERVRLEREKLDLKRKELNDKKEIANKQLAAQKGQK
jgi:hypothetical protein